MAFNEMATHFMLGIGRNLVDNTLDSAHTDRILVGMGCRWHTLFLTPVSNYKYVGAGDGSVSKGACH